jgi:hypothetical protein
MPVSEKYWWAAVSIEELSDFPGINVLSNLRHI